LRNGGSQLDVYPGILPITNAAQLRRMAELSGTPLPQSVKERIEAVESDAVEVRKVGIDIASEICAELLSRGVPGLHFYTMNSAASTLEIVKRIGLR
jgi:methylenetetrahydrofolate reductase (NADPH)